MKKLFFITIFFMMRAFAAENANEILKTIDKNLMPDSYEAYRQLINEEPDGKKKEFTFFTLKKGKDKIAMLYLTPASEKGRSTLRLGDNMWLFIPNVNKPVRITSLQSIVGGVFNNADIMTLEYSAEYDAQFESDSKTDYVLTLKAKTKTVAYDRLKMWATKDKKILRKVECYGASGMLIKTLEFKNDKDFGNDLVRPSVVETFSPLYKGYKSYMIYQKIKARQVPDEAFTLQFMNRLGQLK